MMMGEQLMPYLSGQGAVYVFKTNNFWTVLKSAGYASLRGITRALIWGGGGGVVNINIFVFCLTNFF